jgi:hypothetical protein
MASELVPPLSFAASMRCSSMPAGNALTDFSGEG